MQRTHRKTFILAKGFLPDHGGIERYSADLTAAFAEIGHRPLVLTQSSHGKGIYRHRGGLVIDIGAQSSQIRALFLFLGAWLTIRRRYLFTTKLATTWRASLPLMISLTKTYGLSVHGREVFVVPKVLRPVMKVALYRASAIFVVSKAIRDLITAPHPGIAPKTTVVWNGISFAPEAAANEIHAVTPDNPVRLLTVCRLVERKNIDGAIRACIQIARARPDLAFEYTICGDGPERPVLEARVKESGMEGRIKLLGFVDDATVIELYRNCQIFLHPQIAARNGGDIEGFGLSIADAMSFGQAVIAGKAGGPADFVRDGDTGRLVDGTDPDEIVESLTLLLSDHDEIMRLGRNARAFALQELSWETSARKITETIA